ncbi:MAG: 30S ribosomal protein S15 [bacterium]
MNQTVEERQEIIEDFRLHEEDNGSPEVQIALTTDRIKKLTEHMKDHPQDYSSRKGLQRMVEKRRSLLEYLLDKDEERYKQVVSKLGL